LGGREVQDYGDIGWREKAMSYSIGKLGIWLRTGVTRSGDVCRFLKKNRINIDNAAKLLIKLQTQQSYLKRNIRGKTKLSIRLQNSADRK
jgi:hypothetical protein